MNAIILLFLIGIVFLAFEVVVPGAVMGILGGCAMIIGCVIAFSRYGLSGGVIAVAAGVILVALTMYVEFVLLPRTRTGKKMFLQSAVTATSQPPPADAAEVVGKDAEAITVLAPSGYVLCGGKRYEAFCQDGHAAKGTKLRVTAVDYLTLKVTKT